MDYVTALKKAMEQEEASPRYALMDGKDLQRAIVAITEELKGPMRSSERIIQAAIRRGMQAELARRTK